MSSLIMAKQLTAKVASNTVVKEKIIKAKEARIFQVPLQKDVFIST